MYEYAGHMHIHSTHSDGSGSIKEIAEAARKASLDFVIITDHNNLGGRVAGEEGYHGGVLVLVGLELEVQGRGEHCLVLGLQDIPPATPSADKFLAQIRDRGGASFLAHPYELGSPILYKGRAFVWNPVPDEGFDGLEIWNYSSRWRDGCHNFPQAFLRYYLKRPGLALEPCPLTLEKWDLMTRKRPVSAVGGSDAHAIHLKLGPLRPVIFPYEDLFRGVNMHLYLREPLSSSFDAAEKQVVEALRRGSSFVAYDGFVSSRGFTCSLTHEGKEYLPGEGVPRASGGIIRAEAPTRRCRLAVIQSGREVFTTSGPRLTYPVKEPGPYRLEAALKPSLGRHRPWIYTNPFYVGGPY